MPLPAFLVAILGVFNPFDWLLIGMIVLSDFTQIGSLISGETSIFSLAAMTTAALMMIALMKINLPNEAKLLFFVIFWTLTVPNILSAAQSIGAAQYFNLFGIPLLTVAFFVPYLILMVFFVPMVLGWYRTLGLLN